VSNIETLSKSETTSKYAVVVPSCWSNFFDTSKVLNSVYPFSLSDL